MARIAYISSTFPDYKKCGTGIYAGFICQALAQQGHDIHVITSATPEIRPTLGKLTIHKIMQSWNPLDLPRLVQTFQIIKPEIIHINHPTAIAAQKSKLLVNMLPELNRGMWKLPLITTLHEYIHVSFLGRLKLQPFLYSSDLVTVTNERARAAVCKNLPTARHSKIRVVNIGSSLNENQAETSAAEKTEQRKRWGLNDNDRVIGFIGFMTPPKGFHNLIEAAAPLLRLNKNFKVLALSSWNMSSSAYRQQLLDKIEKEQITSQVIFSGFIEDEDLWQSLSAIDLCVFPFDEPVEDRSSGPLRQAIFRGLPTMVSADNRNYSEFGFRHGENIWLSPIGDVKTLTADIENLLNDSKLREKIADGTKGLRARLSNDVVSNSFSRMYAELLQK